MPLASSTSINKLQVMLNTELRTATGCTQDTNIQHIHDETLTLPIHEHLQLHASQYKQKSQHPSHPSHKHTTHFNTIFNSVRYTTNFPQIHYNRHKKHVPCTYNNKILRTPPPHIISSEEILHRLTRHTLAQLALPKITLHKVILTQSRRQITSISTMLTL